MLNTFNLFHLPDVPKVKIPNPDLDPTDQNQCESMRIVSSTLTFNPTKSVSEPDSSLRHGGSYQELQPVQGGHGRGQTVPTVHHKVRPKNIYHKEDNP
jgi:hypothetical protein